jgi:hypothetical protein
VQQIERDGFQHCQTWVRVYTTLKFLALQGAAYIYIYIYVTLVKVKVKVPLTDPKAQREGRGIAVLFLDLGTRRGGWSAPRPGCFTPRKDPVPIVQEAGWAPGPVWTVAKNLAPTEIRSPDHSARIQSLYRLSYPGPYDISRLRFKSYICLTLSRHLLWKYDRRLEWYM